MTAANLAIFQSKENDRLTFEQYNQIEWLKDSVIARFLVLKNNIARLSDLNNDSVIDGTLRDVVNENVLRRALSQLTNGGDEESMKAMYKRVTGKDATGIQEKDRYCEKWQDHK